MKTGVVAALIKCMAKFSIRFKGKGWGIGMQHSQNIWLPFLLKTGEYGGCSYYETMALFLDCFKVKGWGREGGGWSIQLDRWFCFNFLWSCNPDKEGLACLYICSGWNQ